MGSLTILRAGPALSVQDLGRPGHLSEGLSPGGAMDRLALLEAAALLDLPDVVPATLFPYTTLFRSRKSVV